MTIKNNNVLHYYLYLLTSIKGGDDGDGEGVAYALDVGRYRIRRAVMERAEPNSERTALAHGIRVCCCCCCTYW